VQRLPLAFHQRQQTGDLLYRITADTEAIQTLTIHGLFPLCTSLALVIGMSVLMAQIDGVLTLVALGVCPVLLVVLAQLGTRIDQAATAVSQCESAVHTLVQRTLSPSASSRPLPAKRRKTDDFGQSSARCVANLQLHGLITLYTGVVDIILALGTAVLVWVGARHVLHGVLSVGDLVVFTAYLAALYGPISTMSRTMGLLEGAKVGYRRVQELLTAEHGIPEGTRVVSAHAVRGAVHFERVTFGYTPERPILRGIEVEVAPGQLVALVGPTGAGKSTLMHLLPRFYDPQEGRVLLDGVDVREYTLASLRQQIAMVFQPPLVFPGTIADNIAYGRPGAAPEAIIRAARLACLHDMIMTLPHGYSTLLGEQGATLSESERQRLTIARALLRDAPILILDEPTSAVDAETQALLMVGLAHLIVGRTTFIIAHRLSTIRHADTIWVMQDGQMVEQGSFAQLLRQQGHFAALYQTEIRLYEDSITVG
jgi:ATP-binding cassette subfamily B protein